MNSIAKWAREIARQNLETTLPRRWAHTQGVARQARTLVPILGDQADLLEAAAWLHDVGYAPDLAVTGFHPLDGARYLRDVHEADDHLCRLVAHHSCALVEARERSLSSALKSEFGDAPPKLNEPLIYCDMTTSPDGTEIEVEERLLEVISRYGEGHPVTRSIIQSTPQLVGAVNQIRDHFVFKI